ncbi:MAG: macro domain-containing protein [Gammaproteobacteria bacterium]
MVTPNSTRLKSITLECLQGDITRQPDMDAVVNAANAQLMSGGGVAGAIHSMAGPGLARECEPLAPIRPGQAVITGAHGLPNKHIIHCLGPVYGVDHPEEKLLASCYRSALNLAETYSLTSIAFPAISTGAFGYPFREAARICVRTLADFNSYKSLQRIRIVLWNEKDRDMMQQTITEISD